MTASDESRSTRKTDLHVRKVHFTALYRRVAGFIYYPVATMLRAWWGCNVHIQIVGIINHTLI